MEFWYFEILEVCSGKIKTKTGCPTLFVFIEACRTSLNKYDVYVCVCRTIKGYRKGLPACSSAREQAPVCHPENFPRIMDTGASVERTRSTGLQRSAYTLGGRVCLACKCGTLIAAFA